MKTTGRAWYLEFLLLLVFSSIVPRVLARSGEPKKDAIAVAATRTSNADSMRVQGEQRFRANCGRCHAAPQKFPSRMMATVLRHMRVRATITAEDQRLILFYMTQ